MPSLGNKPLVVIPTYSQGSIGFGMIYSISSATINKGKSYQTR